MKRWLLTALLLALLTAAGGTARAEKWEAVVGQTAPEIALTCADGREFSLYDALKTKELAVVCVFGSGCGACQRELRAMEAAYRPLADRIAVVGLSLDISRDRDEVLLAFAQTHGLSFPLGRDPIRVARFMQINMYPAFMVVDQTGAVRWIEVNGEATEAHLSQVLGALLEAED